MRSAAGLFCPVDPGRYGGLDSAGGRLAVRHNQLRPPGSKLYGVYDLSARQSRQAQPAKLGATSDNRVQFLAPPVINVPRHSLVASDPAFLLDRGYGDGLAVA